MSNRQLVCFLSNSVVTRPSPLCNTAINMIKCSTFISAPAQPFEEGYIDFLSRNRMKTEEQKWEVEEDAKQFEESMTSFTRESLAAPS